MFPAWNPKTVEFPKSEPVQRKFWKCCTLFRKFPKIQCSVSWNLWEEGIIFFGGLAYASREGGMGVVKVLLRRRIQLFYGFGGNWLSTWTLFSISFQSWLSHEVEVLVSVGQARQTLENLIDDRKVLSRQLAELRSQEQDEDDEPAAKVLSVCLSVYLFLSACLSVGFSTFCFHFFQTLCFKIVPFKPL